LAPINYRVVNRALPLTLLCVKGSIATGPDGTILFNTFDGKPKRDLVYELCSVADYVLALGIWPVMAASRRHRLIPPQQWGCSLKMAGLAVCSAKDWRSRKGPPVVNVAGCAADADTLLAAMRWLLAGDADPRRLDRLGHPAFVRPCLSAADRPKCGTAQWVGHSCYGCIGQKFPLSRDLLKWTEARKCASET
jgi:Ni,Fe-hydrogenase I small subunit